MTKEEIHAKAVDYATERIKEVDKNSLSAIADYDRGLIQGFEDGAEWMQEKMIERAVRFIHDTIYNWADGSYHQTFSECRMDYINEFKKAMEE